MKTTNLPLEKLIAYAGNPRRNDHAVEAVAAAIKRFGFRVPVLAKSDGSLIDGHLRIKAAKRLGMAEVPVVLCDDLSEAEIKALRISINRMAELAEWDEELLMAELEGLAAEGVTMDDVGFDLDALEALGASVEPEGNPEADAEPQIDKAEELRAKWGVEPGQLWELGEHRLLCGDSTKKEDVERVMGGERADLCFTSPPYGVSSASTKLRDHYVRGAKTRDSFYKDHDDDPDQWAGLMDGWFAAARPHVECVICNVQMLADNKTDLIRWVADRCDDLVDVVIWDKIHAAPQMQSGVMSNAFEFLFVFGGNGSRSMPFADWHGTVSNIVRIDPRGKNDNADNHRAVMPSDLPLWVMNTLCPKASSVLEPFCGTGTTIIACEQLGRKARAIEISPAYCAVAIQRWADATGKTPRLVP
jgi:hypothetical protein